MKIEGIPIIALLITIILFSWGSIINDFETNYIDTNISSASAVNETFKINYSRVGNITETFSPLEESIKDVGESKGWFDELLSGSIVLIKAVVLLPGMILITVYNLITDGTAASELIGIPTELIITFALMFLIYVIFRVISYVKNTA